ncbi:MAG: hypothetical protein II631_08735, partial [Treponema sp.]|nr:hypothetical protein [Treponema sp.]
VCKRIPVLHEKRDAAVTAFMQMVGYLPSCADVVDGYEIAVAPLCRVFRYPLCGLKRRPQRLL